MGCGDARRAWTSQASGGENNGVVDRDNYEDTGRARYESTSDPILAVKQPSVSRNDGGPTNTATDSNEEAGEWNDRERRNRHAKEDGSRS
ncbi:hypothetical protein D3C72_2097490 [compost metagenome]